MKGEAKGVAVTKSKTEKTELPKTWTAGRKKKQKQKDLEVMDGSQ